MAVAKTGIEWTDSTWSPVTGCSKVSPGCAHCYAEGVANRFWATQYPRIPVTPIVPSTSGLGPLVDRARCFTDVQCHEDRLDQPLRWKKPRKVFVNSMSDLFHEDVPDAFIDKVFAVMALAPQHTFQVLTKRAERMRAYMTEQGRERRYAIEDEVFPIAGENDALTIRDQDWPLKNVWLGVSVENQRFADERIPLLLQTPAAVRFISAEPLLEPIDLEAVPLPGSLENWYGLRGVAQPKSEKDTEADDWKYWTRHGAKLDWVIIGGESGRGARPFKVQWARAILAQCKAAGVAAFMKQLGANLVDDDFPADRVNPETGARTLKVRQVIEIRDRKGGDMAEWSPDLRVREFPNVR